MLSVVGSEDSASAKLLFSAGMEGIIRVWTIPDITDEKYPTTGGNNYCVGVWNDKISEPIW